VKSRFVKLLGLLLAVTLSGNPVPPAHATNINISPSLCQASGPPTSTPGLIIYGDLILNESHGPLNVTCSVPRSPLATAATAGSFYVDGWIPHNGDTMYCSVVSQDYNGSSLGSGSFALTAVHDSQVFDGFITMPAQQLPYWGYTWLNCSMPKGSGLMGVTVVQ
jgi:hypothetical protein